MLPNPQETAGLITFTGETLIEKLHFCAAPKRCTKAKIEAM